MNEKGFSLIELLIVVAILGVITALAVPNLIKARAAANESRAVKYVRSWSSGQDMYQKANGCYASADEDLVIGGFVQGKPIVGGNADDVGYTYSINSNGCAQPNPERWWGVANRRNTFSSSYYIDQTGVIRRAVAATANATDSPM